MTDENGRPYDVNEYKLEVSPVGVVLVRKESAQAKPTVEDKPSTKSEKS